ncbi:hypothetical protein D9Q98_008038 [Chlorella vulgaris]|uniref:Glutathione peroxidase n=1 Tax=Chlorella vulgaris TaxID=3077 RepID=A0A9D4TI61_CHLVU|nr:hypothetical protein D9Q98_008038 [Chlorella vulgaris]
MVATACASAAATTAVKTVNRVSSSRVASRASIFTGAQLRRTVSAAPARKANMQSVRALFGGGGSSAATSSSPIYDFKVKGIDGSEVKLDRYKGKVLLVVNVASACGFTPQYTEMTELYNKYNKQGLEILAFPCNQFGSQEPGSNSEIKSFAERKGFKGPIFAKTDVNGSNAEPLWTYLKSKQGGMLTSDVKWNFTKFLVDRSGEVVKRYGSTTTPLAIESDIAALL